MKSGRNRWWLRICNVVLAALVLTAVALAANDVQDDGEMTRITIASEDGRDSRDASVSADGIIVATGKGDIRITEIQLQDRKRMAVSAFVKGNPIPVGTQLG